MPNIYEKRAGFFPIEYPQFWDLWEESERAHWVYNDVPLLYDLNDYKTMHPKLSQLIHDTLLLFTQSDSDVCDEYIDRYAQMFSAKPELRMLLASIAAREAVHQAAYSILNKTLGLPDSDMELYKTIPAMKAKHEYNKSMPWLNANITDPVSQYKEIAALSSFVEGFSLFSSFAILISFAKPEVNKMRGVKTIVQYSIIDERLHFHAMQELAKVIRAENPEEDWELVDDELIDLAHGVLKREFDFVDYLFRDFAESDSFHIDANQVKCYLGQVMNNRLSDLALGVKCNDWAEVGDIDINSNTELNDLITTILGASVTNFFEQRATQYTKGLNMGNAYKLEYPKLYGV